MSSCICWSWAERDLKAGSVESALKGRADAVVVGGCQRGYFGWRISGGRKVFFRLDLVRRTREFWAVYSADEVTSSTSQIHSPKKSKRSRGGYGSIFEINGFA